MSHILTNKRTIHLSVHLDICLILEVCCLARLLHLWDGELPFLLQLLDVGFLKHRCRRLDFTSSMYESRINRDKWQSFRVRNKGKFLLVRRTSEHVRLTWPQMFSLDQKKLCTDQCRSWELQVLQKTSTIVKQSQLLQATGYYYLLPLVKQK